MSKEDGVLFADDEKAGPASAAVIDAQADSQKKKAEEFRNYKSSNRQAVKAQPTTHAMSNLLPLRSASSPTVTRCVLFVQSVEEFYRLQHMNQTYDFVCAMEEKYLSLSHFTMGLWDCLLFLDKLVDDSDPDTQNSQLQHALQTAESCRRLHPDKDWMHLTGLIHDLGKILSMACNEPQWAVVGDTFPVGCAFSDQAVFPQYFALNPDSRHPVYSTQLGVYRPHCGLKQVKMSWGHDMYLYEVCVRNHCSLPPEALAMIRFHSFYPWHKHGAYSHLTNAEDDAMKYWVLEFNKCDLYSKDAPLVDVEAVKPYYTELIAKYFPPTLKW